MNNREVLTLTETAELLGISTASVANWEKHGLLNSGGSRTYARREVESLLGRIKKGEINRLNRRANKKHCVGSILPNGILKKACESLLKIEMETADLMFLLSLRLFIEAGLISYSSENSCNLARLLQFRTEDYSSSVITTHLKNFMPSSGTDKLLDPFTNIMSLKLPSASPAELDIAGIIYQALRQRGDRSVSGSFYTPPEIADAMVSSALRQLAPTGSPPADIRIIDPCCGTGQFLLSFIKAGGSPENAFGTDIDAIAVFTAGTNIILQHPGIDAEPRIYCADSLLMDHFPGTQSTHESTPFDAAITNPPWGACTDGKKQILEQRYPEIKSGESFSFFIDKSLNLVKPGGVVSIVLPEAITNVKRHDDIRRLVLKNCRLTDITGYGRAFKGVYTPVVTVELIKNAGNKHLLSNHNGKNFSVNNDFTFSINLNSDDAKIIDRLYAIPHFTLKDNADWALGIVTGDNSKYLSAEKNPGFEPVITGSNILPGRISLPGQFIQFNPERFQQVAPEWKYRSTEKLVYRFISNRLVFAIDRSGMLTLNSANNIIPHFDKMENKETGHAATITEIMELFNSELYNFVYRKRFNSVKILRSHLEQLPIINPEKLADFLSNTEKVRILN